MMASLSCSPIQLFPTALYARPFLLIIPIKVLSYPSKVKPLSIQFQAFKLGIWMFLEDKVCFMALSDTKAMCGKENKSNKEKLFGVHISIPRTFSLKYNSGMAYELIESKYKILLTSNIFYINASFKPWSLKIPINDGYHESLCIDLCHL